MNSTNLSVHFCYVVLTYEYFEKRVQTNKLQITIQPDKIPIAFGSFNTGTLFLNFVVYSGFSSYSRNL